MSGQRSAMTRWRWANIGVALVAIAIAARTVPWAEVASGVGTASMRWLAVAVIAAAVAVIARAGAWSRLLRAIGVHSPHIAVRATVLAMALNCVLIGNAGELARVAIVVRETRARLGSVVASIALERLLVTVPFLMLLVAVGAALPLPPVLARWYIPVVTGIPLIALGVLLMLRARRSVVDGGRLPRWAARMSRAIERLRSAGRTFLDSGCLTTVLGWDALHWLSQYASLMATAAALGFALSPGEGLLTLLALSAAGTARITPGNIGINQIAVVGTAEMLDLPATGALSVALVLHGVQVAPLLVGAVVVSVCRRRSAARDFLDGSNPGGGGEPETTGEHRNKSISRSVPR